MGTEPDHHDATWARLAWAAPVLPLVIGALALAAERGELISAPVAIATTAIAAAALLGVIATIAANVRSRSEAERRELLAKVDKLVDRDLLTGAFNHRRLNEELRRQLAFAQRYGAQMAVLAVQLDGFQEILRSYGQATADELVITTAEVLTDELRTTDVVVRRVPHGFFVLLPQTDAEAARIVAAKLVRRLRAIERGRQEGDSIALRASIGVALSDPRGLDHPERLVARADRALAAARAEGGDRLALPEEPVLD